MKINIGDKIIDTDKMSDEDAEIWEALENFNTICTKYKVMSYASFANKNDIISCFCIDTEVTTRNEELEILKNMFDNCYEQYKRENDNGENYNGENE